MGKPFHNLDSSPLNHQASTASKTPPAPRPIWAVTWIPRWRWVSTGLGDGDGRRHAVRSDGESARAARVSVHESLGQKRLRRMFETMPEDADVIRWVYSFLAWGVYLGSLPWVLVRADWGVLAELSVDFVRYTWTRISN